MNGQDYIRKAVELADGFEWNNAQTVKTPVGLLFLHTNEMFKDALAAQLVRQVDASGRADFYSVPDAAEVQWEYENSDELDTSYIKGPDRTMNTIRAIVDSGVLSE